MTEIRSHVTQAHDHLNEEVPPKLLSDHAADVLALLVQTAHAASIIRRPNGVEVWVCCLGSFWVPRDAVADPYLLDVEDPREVLQNLLEVFSTREVSRGRARVP